MRQGSFVFLSIAPFVIMPLAGARPLRIPGVYQAVGAVLFLIIAAAVWMLAFHRSELTPERRRLAVAGSLFVAPFAFVALLWIGLGTPWDATPSENVMRYSVLLGAAFVVTMAFTLLRDAIADAGERIWSAVGGAATTLAGAAYVVWMSFELGAHAVRMNRGAVPESLRAVSSNFDTLLFAACALTYVGVLAFARAMRSAGLLGRVSAGVYTLLNLVLLALLTIRGLSFPDPTRGAAPWYVEPGFIAGIPAIPWVMPFLFGVVLLRRAGAGQRSASVSRPSAVPVTT